MRFQHYFSYLCNEIGGCSVMAARKTSDLDSAHLQCAGAGSIPVTRSMTEENIQQQPKAKDNFRRWEDPLFNDLRKIFSRAKLREVLTHSSFYEVEGKANSRYVFAGMFVRFSSRCSSPRRSRGVSRATPPIRRTSGRRTTAPGSRASRARRSRSR